MENDKRKDGAQAKSFVCAREGCNKRFTRAEHLQRHILNHTEGGATCPRCRAHFKRPDLLDRHLQRHRQRDEEAGGEGHGVLNTRKRSWKAFDGSVVEKRPALEPTTASVDASSSSSSSSYSYTTELSSSPDQSTVDVNSTNVVSASHTVTAVGADLAPLSPPTSSGRSDQGPLTIDYESRDVDDARNSFASDPPSVSLTSGHDPLEDVYWPQIQDCSSWMGPISLQQHGRDDNNYTNNNVDNGYYTRALLEQPMNTLFDEVFQPDTASSFNMPYTTAGNYNWLFSTEGPLDSALIDQTMQMQATFSEFLPPEQQQQQQQQQQQPQPNFNEAFADATSRNDMPGDRIGAAPDSHRRIDAAHAVTLSSQNAAAIPVPDDTPRTRRLPVQKNQAASSRVAGEAVPELERPLSSIQPPTNLPVIDPDTSRALRDLIESCHPACPGGYTNLREHPLLSTASLQTFSNLFFTRFNTAYPLIHQATFAPRETEPLLLLTIVLLGATYSSKEAHQLSVCIHDVIRPKIFAHAGFTAKPALWVLQTILLVECFGKSRAGEKQHDMSHLFHGLLINLIRRSDCQSVRPVVAETDGKHHPHPNARAELGAPDELWKRWAVDEQKKRLALLCFMWDTQHAVLFCQSLCMSAFELRVAMPCNQTLWEAPDARAWKRVAGMQRGPEVLFLTSLKAYLTPKAPRPQHLNALSRILVLHGLLSISWDMQRRDQTSLGVINVAGGGSWRDRLSDAYDLWKTDFDAYCMDVAIRQQQKQQSATAAASASCSFGPGPAADWEATSREFATFSTSFNAIYHAGHVLLNSDFIDVQIYAGARHILGRPVLRTDYLHSERIVKQWAAAGTACPASNHADLATAGAAAAAAANKHTKNTPSSTENNGAAAAKAAWHAACLLHDACNNLTDFDAMGLFHVPWCLYLATLTCWAFYHARPKTTSGWRGAEDDCDNEGEIVWDARKEMDDLVSSMSGTKPWNLMLAQSKRNTAGLVWVMANVLSNFRWGIIRSGVIVLRGLVPSRMVNQYAS
ncbi:Transcription factor [Niveomyces insectorum RCEF 264]|uniref:Transcription factor n=1 Tax=Niveomyces insectorum RCEF 264 TaxID=1081102 RepID=A0A167T6Q5_9HYPO|nr:Transcription factor [Niveomyces insectorum RCEF 264]